MKFSFSCNYKQFKIKSSWFKVGDSLIQDNSPLNYKHFFLYTNLYRFRIYETQEKDTFSTCIDWLVKVTKYSAEEVYKLLVDLKREKIILICLSKFEQQIKDGEGKLKKDKCLMIETLDKPKLNRVKNENGDWVDELVTDYDNYITINVEVLQYYIDLYRETNVNKLKPDRVLLPIYCVLRKYSNGNAAEKKTSIGVEKIADAVGLSKNYVNDVIEQMNMKGLVSSVKRKKQNSKKEPFEHRLAHNMDLVRFFKDEIEVSPNAYQKKVLKKHSKLNPFLEDDEAV